MKTTFRNIFRPILRVFESGQAEYRYETSHRKILLAVGALFLFLSMVSAALTVASSQWAGVLPALIFFVIGFVCEVIGFLGNDRAVARIWGN